MNKNFEFAAITDEDLDDATGGCGWRPSCGGWGGGWGGGGCGGNQTTNVVVAGVGGIGGSPYGYPPVAGYGMPYGGGIPGAPPYGGFGGGFGGGYGGFGGYGGGFFGF